MPYLSPSVCCLPCISFWCSSHRVLQKGDLAKANLNEERQPKKNTTIGRTLKDGDILKAPVATSDQRLAFRSKQANGTNKVHEPCWNIQNPASIVQPQGSCNLHCRGWSKSHPLAARTTLASPEKEKFPKKKGRILGNLVNEYTERLAVDSWREVQLAMKRLNIQLVISRCDLGYQCQVQCENIAIDWPRVVWLITLNCNVMIICPYQVLQLFDTCKECKI